MAPPCLLKKGQPSTYEHHSVIKHLPGCDVGFGSWLFHSIIRAITTRWAPVCMCVQCLFSIVEGRWMVNKYPLVTGCTANIYLSVLQHVAGQIKHSSNSQSPWHGLSPWWISLRLSDTIKSHTERTAVWHFMSKDSALTSFSNLQTPVHLFIYNFLSYYPIPSVLCQSYISISFY